jgi:hypothetical protein
MSCFDFDMKKVPKPLNSHVKVNSRVFHNTLSVLYHNSKDAHSTKGRREGENKNLPEIGENKRDR